jgi:hypothetical protein
MQKNLLDRAWSIANIIFGVFICILLISFFLFPAKEGGWLESSNLLNNFLSFVISTCFTIIIVVPTYYSWTLNQEEFWEWNKRLYLSIMRKFIEMLDDKEIFIPYYFWLTRIIGSIASFYLISVSIYLLIMIFVSIFTCLSKIGLTNYC